MLSRMNFTGLYSRYLYALSLRYPIYEIRDDDDDVDYDEDDDEIDREEEEEDDEVLLM